MRLTRGTSLPCGIPLAFGGVKIKGNPQSAAPTAPLKKEFKDKDIASI